MHIPIRKYTAKSAVIWTEIFVKKAKLQRSVEFSGIKILDEDVQTVPVLPIDGEPEGGHHLWLINS